MKQLVTVNCTRNFAVALGVHYELQTYFMLRELKKQTSVRVRWCQRMSNIITDVTANLITLNDVCARAFHLTTYVHTLSTTVLQCGTNLYISLVCHKAPHMSACDGFIVQSKYLWAGTHLQSTRLRISHCSYVRRYVRTYNASTHTWFGVPICSCT